MSATLLVETTRALPGATGAVENAHFGAIAVTNSQGKLLFRAGDENYPTFTRSTLKPFQALPLLRSDGHLRLGLDSGDLAVICSSHSGEQCHLERVSNLLHKIGASEGDLRCGAHAPLFYSTLGTPLPAHAQWNQLHNNCSGKHAGFLAWCHLHGAALETYLDPDHALQGEIRAVLGELTGLDEERVQAGVDGCSAPNYRLPLSAIARLYARLAARPGRQRDADDARLELLFDAMTQHPELVAGQGRQDLTYMSMRAGDWVSKAGADGVQAFASRKLGLGVAVKIADGSARALHAAFVETLSQLGLLDESERARLANWHKPPIRNYRGIETGRVRAAFTLERG